MAIKHGNDRDNFIKGTDQDDTILGLGGDDVIWGLEGNDELEGGSGRDKLLGGSGDDDLDGGRGHDVLNGGGGVNELEGGRGDDLFIFTTGVTTIDDFGLDNDTLLIDDALGVDTWRELKALAHTSDEDLVLDFGKHELRLDDVKLADLRASDVEFI